MWKEIRKEFWRFAGAAFVIALIFSLGGRLVKHIVHRNESPDQKQARILKDAVDYYNRGVAYSGKSDRDGAIAGIDKAIEIDPRYGAFYAVRDCPRGGGFIELALAQAELRLLGAER
jgi:hypothetical protein